jgi:hypothetical protein
MQKPMAGGVDKGGERTEQTSSSAGGVGSDSGSCDSKETGPPKAKRYIAKNANRANINGIESKAKYVYNDMTNSAILL